MKGIIFMSCLLAVVVYGAYTDKYDNFDYKEAMENDKLLQGYMKCLLNQGPCTPEGNELKSHVKDALQNKCAECNEKQKEGVEYCIRYLIEHKPEYWNSLCDEYDPEGKYRKIYEDEAEKRGIKIPK